MCVDAKFPRFVNEKPSVSEVGESDAVLYSCVVRSDSTTIRYFAAGVSRLFG